MSQKLYLEEAAALYESLKKSRFDKPTVKTYVAIIKVTLNVNSTQENELGLKQRI